MLIESILALVLLAIALLGTARIGLFALNRMVFGQKTDEHDVLKWMIVVLPPILLALTTLYYPLYRAFEDGHWTPWATAGGIWLTAAAGTGVYWIVDRAYQNLKDPHVAGTRTLPSEIIKIRKAHIPFRWLRRLGFHNDLYDLEITTHEISVTDLPSAFDGYHIAFLTDTHVASFMRRAFYRECVEQVNGKNVDLILLGGDLVTWKRHIPLMRELLVAPLEARDGIYAVLGNHDYWADADGIIAALTSCGVRYLVNRSVTLRRGSDEIDLLGVDELYRGRPDVEEAFRSVDGSRPTLAVSHHPDIIRHLRERRVDLLVCGHTHGGQIRLPYFGAIVVPSKHESRYAAGFVREGNVLMYISRGLGAIPPIRILCRPEMAVFILRRGKQVQSSEFRVQSSEFRLKRNALSF